MSLRIAINNQANHQVDEVMCKIMIVMLYFDFEKLTS